ncbi:hypothetical protein BC833DRAFT_610457 [Globomyces pollinis-pini]|nr:hypothetical protein BC833DRAFT_610457 [Globomyces pollinis-pini]
MPSNVDIYDLTLLAAVLGVSATYLVWNYSTKSAPPKPTIKSVPVKKAPVITKKKSIIEKLESLDSDKLVVIFFGSQTGTAEDFAERTNNDISNNLNIPSIVLDTDDYDMTELTQWKDFTDRKWLVGFFMATYGEGEPTDNSAEFYNWIMGGEGHGLREDKGEQDDQMSDDRVCENMSFFMFGLGNKTYEHFNAVPRRLSKRLIKLGASQVGVLGEGDDDASMEDDYMKWASEILKNVAVYFDIALDTKKGPHVPLYVYKPIANLDRPAFQGELTSPDPTKSPRMWDFVDTNEFVEKNPPKVYDQRNPYYAKFKHSRPLFQNTHDKHHFAEGDIVIQSKYATVDGKHTIIPRQCYHVELDLGNSGLKYTTGDHVGIWASNDFEQVSRLAKVLKINDMNENFKLEPNPENKRTLTQKITFPTPCSIRHALTHYLDIEAVMKQHHLEILADYAGDENEKKRILQLVENRDLFVKLIENGQKCLAGILEDFPSIQVPLGVVMTEILRTINLRYYSISSSSKEHPNHVTVTAVVVRYALPQIPVHGKSKTKVVLKQGLATSWFERLHEDRVSGTLPESNQGVPPLYCPIYIRSSGFRLPSDHSLPIVMVGPGTGVAPFRGFIRERFMLASEGIEVGPTWLFTGCRNEANDYLYGDEFSNILNQIKSDSLPMDLQVVTAFSRDTEAKVYVQHRIQQESKRIWEFLHTHKGHFYICGDAKNMAHDVKLAIENIATEAGVNSKDWFKDLKAENRYFEDVW